MEEAVVYCKALIKTGLGADTPTPAGMRHRFAGFNLKPPLFSTTVS